MATQTYLPSRPPAAPPDDHLWHNGVYYPSEDGELLAEGTQQALAMYYLFGALAAWFRDSEDIFVVMDLLIYYFEGDASQSIAPDVAVMFGVSHKDHRSSWRSWLEDDILPSVVVEFASPNTWRDDVGVKRERYSEMGVEEYWRSDPSGQLPVPVLVGERLVNGRYQPIELRTDQSGILRGYSEKLKLEFCAMPDGELRLYDPIEGKWLRSMDKDAQDDLERAEVARERAEAEVRRLRQLLESRNGDV